MKKWQKWSIAGVLTTIFVVALVIAIVKTTSANRQNEEAQAKVAALEAKVAKPTPTETPAEKAHKSNMDSWLKHKDSATLPAQINLAPDWGNVVRELVDENFTNHDQRVVEAVGRKIYSIAGDRATAIILEYVDDPRAIVAENARDWYKKYHPGAILDKIEAKNPTPPPPPIRTHIDLRTLHGLEQRVDSLEAAYEKAHRSRQTVSQVTTEERSPSYDCLRMEIKLLEREREVLRELNAAKTALRMAQGS